MSDYSASTYGDRIADIYDELHALAEDAEEAAASLAELAGGGIALELGIGTGRVALPLAARGVEVHGLDASQAMVDKLVSKAGGASIPVTIGDFTEVDVAGPFSLVYIVFNTFFGLTSQDDQVRCFANVADHLLPGGRFVLQAFVPDVSRFDRDQRTSATRIELEEVVLEASIHEPAFQRVRSAHVLVSERGIRLFPVHIRYCWPSELDLMARLAGLELEHRWSSWDREPFLATSTGHVSVYRRPQ